MLYAWFSPCRHLSCTVVVLKSFYQIGRKTCFRAARANPSYLGQTSLWWQMLPLKGGELTEEYLRTQGMWSLQGTRAICLLLKTVSATVQMLTDSFINTHFFYRHCGLQAFLVSGDHLILSIHHWTISITWYLWVSLNSGQMLFHFFQQEVKSTFLYISLLKRLLHSSSAWV